MNQLRKFTSEAELLAHYKAVHKRLRGAYRRKLTPVVVQPDPPALPEPPLHEPCIGHIDEAVFVATWPAPAIATLLLSVLERRYDVAREHIVGGCRNGKLVRIRHIAFYILRLLRPGFSLPMIGRFFGHRDHTTVLHGCRRMAQKCATDPAVKAEVDSIIAEVHGRTATRPDNFTRGEAA